MGALQAPAAEFVAVSAQDVTILIAVCAVAAIRLVRSLVLAIAAWNALYAQDPTRREAAMALAHMSLLPRRRRDDASRMGVTPTLVLPGARDRSRGQAD